MNWLNIEIKNIRCVDVVGSSPAEVGTWLLAFAYCCEQENSGIICGIKSWKTRQVQRAIGITHSEILQADKLMFYTGDDLTVKFYPIEKQEEVQAKRKAGIERARSRWSGQAGSSAISSADAEVEVEVEVERNENKKGKETPAHAQEIPESEPAQARHTRNQRSTVMDDPRIAAILDDPQFQRFCADYPAGHRCSPRVAAAAFAALRAPAFMDDVLAGLEISKSSEAWQEKGGKFATGMAKYIETMGWQLTGKNNSANPTISAGGKVRQCLCGTILLPHETGKLCRDCKPKGARK
jgi:hypothetical protein